jgi:hypothetical protein
MYIPLHPLLKDGLFFQVTALPDGQQMFFE